MSSSLSFKARRRAPELVTPARPTPRETKDLSDIDDQHALRYYETVIGFFRRCHGQSDDGPEDLVATVRAALAEALVYYYPVAGRLREDAGGEKLVVDCTAEGVVFVEADADVRLEDFGEPLMPPYPCVEELLCDAGDTRAVIGRPLLFMQLTRLKCGGFVGGFHMCHNMADGFGMIQLMISIAELACGAQAPSILPVWKRDVLTSTTTHSPTPILYPNPSSYEPLLDHSLGSTSDDDDMMLSTPLDEMVVDYFVFGSREMKTLESHIRGRGYLANSVTSFELITTVMWRCRTIALGYKPNHLVHLMVTMNARGRWNHHTPIPWGYYGNAHFWPVAQLTVDELCRQPLIDTVEIVRRTKLSVTSKECMESMLERMASSRNKPWEDPARTYEVSDTKWIAAGNGLQLGWAEFVGGGIPVAGDMDSKIGSDHMRCKNQDGDDSTVVSLLLPRPAMERFKKEMAVWLNKHDDKNLIIQSSL